MTCKLNCWKYVKKTIMYVALLIEGFFYYSRFWWDLIVTKD